jgi:uncharacterized protein RhaS with RHS repeats
VQVAGLRYYSPGLGRWISRDPIGERGGANLLCLVANSPIMHVDPFGEMTWWQRFRLIIEMWVRLSNGEVPDPKGGVRAEASEDRASCEEVREKRDSYRDSLRDDS